MHTFQLFWQDHLSHRAQSTLSFLWFMSGYAKKIVQWWSAVVSISQTIALSGYFPVVSVLFPYRDIMQSWNNEKKQVVHRCVCVRVLVGMTEQTHWAHKNTHTHGHCQRVKILGRFLRALSHVGKALCYVTERRGRYQKERRQAGEKHTGVRGASGSQTALGFFPQRGLSTLPYSGP